MVPITGCPKRSRIDIVNVMLNPDIEWTVQNCDANACEPKHWLNQEGYEFIISVVLGSVDLRPSERSRFGYSVDSVRLKATEIACPLSETLKTNASGEPDANHNSDCCCPTKSFAIVGLL